MTENADAKVGTISMTQTSWKAIFQWQILVGLIFAGLCGGAGQFFGGTLGFVAGTTVGIGVGGCLFAIGIRRYQNRSADHLGQWASNDLGDPMSRYLALVVYQLAYMSRALDRVPCGETQSDIADILAGYASFVEMKPSRLSCELMALEAIAEAAKESEAVRRVVEDRVSKVKDKGIDQVIEEMEKDLSKYTTGGRRAVK
jgi:hypothetical protein